MNVLKKVAKKVENSKIVKNPKFLVIGLIIIVAIITLIYFIFLKQKYRTYKNRRARNNI